MYFLNPVILCAGLLLSWCDFTILFNIKVKKKMFWESLMFNLQEKMHTPAAKITTYDAEAVDLL